MHQLPRGFLTQRSSVLLRRIVAALGMFNTQLFLWPVIDMPYDMCVATFGLFFMFGNVHRTRVDVWKHDKRLSVSGRLIIVSRVTGHATGVLALDDAVDSFYSVSVPMDPTQLTRNVTGGRGDLVRLGSQLGDEGCSSIRA
jgi:hypothetical protein